MKTQIPTLQALGKCQAVLLHNIADFWSNGWPVPVTRLDAYEDSHSICMFEAWAFSTTVPKSSSAQARLNWIFPGWADNLRLADAPDQLHFPYPSTLPAHVGNAAELAALARHVLKYCTDTSVPGKVSKLFLPWLIIDGLPKGDCAQPEHWSEMTKWGAGQLLADALVNETGDVQQRVILDAWPYIKKHQNQEHPVWALIEQQDRAPKFFELIVQHLPLSTFAADLENAKLDYAEIGRLEKLPVDFRRAVLRAIANRLKTNGHAIPHELDEFMKTLKLEDVDLLVQFVGYQYSVGRAAASWVFVIDPERALQETQTALDQGDKTMSTWFYRAPTSLLPQLVHMLEAHDGANLSGLRHWLATTIAKAGVLAPRVFRLLERAGTAT